jgi:PAS domain S-box-containing protein
LIERDRGKRLDDVSLRRLFDANVVGIMISANDGSIVEANDALLAMLGFSRAELAAGELDWRERTPPEWLPLDERAIAELAEHGAFSPYEKEYLRKDGTRVPISVGGARIAGSDVEQICYILDLSEIRQAEAALRESEARYRILAEGLPLMVLVADAQRGLVYANPRYEEYTGIPAAEIGARWSEAIHPDDVPAVERVRASGEPYELEYRLRRHDGIYRWHLARVMRVPGVAGGGQWLGSAMDIDDRKRAEDALRFIERASWRLSQSLDLTTTLATVLDLVVPEYGDWASISMRGDDGEITTIAARHRDPAMDAVLHSLRGVDYFNETHARGTAAVYRTGEPQLLERITPADLRRAVKEPYVAALEQLGFGSLVTVPIAFGDDIIGTLGIRSAGDRRCYSPDDFAPLQELAWRAGFAITNARQYEQQRRVATVLQEAALPRTLPDVPGYRFDAYYRAGRSEALIGGDWFDAHVISGGRIVISVGDVAGSGLDAAVLMGNVRQVLRAAAHLSADPSMMLEIADRTLRSEHAQVLVTAFVGVLDPARRNLVYSSAGHWPGLLRYPDGTIVDVGATGLPLGCRNLAFGDRRAIDLPAGSCLLLYTDGLVEWSRDVMRGEAMLRSCFADAAARNDPRPAQRLVEAVLGGESARDDVAVLTVAVD